MELHACCLNRRFCFRRLWTLCLSLPNLPWRGERFAPSVGRDQLFASKIKLQAARSRAGRIRWKWIQKLNTNWGAHSTVYFNYVFQNRSFWKKSEPWFTEKWNLKVRILPGVWFNYVEGHLAKCNYLCSPINAYV